MIANNELFPKDGEAKGKPHVSEINTKTTNVPIISGKMGIVRKEGDWQPKPVWNSS